MIILGDLKAFENIITSNICIGVFNEKPVPILKYEGKYNKITSKRKFQIEGTIEEMIYEVVYAKEVYKNEGTEEVKYLVTRSEGDPEEINEYNMRNMTKVSIVYANRDAINIWSPTFRDIFDMIKFSYEVNGKSTIDIIGRISEQLYKQKEVNITELINEIYTNNIYDKNRHTIRVFGTVPLSKVSGIFFEKIILFNAIKHIMIVEDLRFHRTGELGRHLFQLALYDYVIKGEEYDIVAEKYGLIKKQQNKTNL